MENSVNLYTKKININEGFCNNVEQIYLKKGVKLENETILVWYYDLETVLTWTISSKTCGLYFVH